MQSPARPFSRALLALGLALVGATGCEDPRPGPIGVVQRVTITTPALTLRPGRVMTAVARPLDADGGFIEIPVLWRSLTPTLLTVEPDGEVRALAPGVGVVESVAGGVTGRLELPLVNPPAALIRLPNDTIRLTLPGAPAVVLGVAVDADGELLVGARFGWSVEAARIAIVNADGLVTPVAVGTTSVTLTLDLVQVVRPVQVRAAESATAPLIAQITSALLTPGTPFTIRGLQFAPTPSANVVVVDGLPASVTAASATQLTAVISASGVPCLPTREVAVQVTTAGGVGAGMARLQVAPQRALAVGGALMLTTASASTCNELADGAGRYLVAVQHGGRALGAGAVALTIDGRTGTAAPTVVTPLSVASVGRGGSGATATALARNHGHGNAHARVLEASAAAVRRVGAAPSLRGAPSLRRAPSLQLPPVNGIVQVRVPDLTSSTNLCNNFQAIGARTVYEGTHVAILEDTLSQRNGAATLAGAMDELYAAIGQEFDTVLWPLAQRFGDPLVMDSRLDANDKVVLVATPRVNEMFDGELLGAVVTCDLYPRSQFAASNVGEIMYLQVPTSRAPGFGRGTRERWRYEIRGTIAHELKHIVSFAGHVVRNQPLEESWLEEATARHAEELFGRARLGFSPTGNTGYGGLDCEVRVLTGSADCADAPRTLLPHFEGLWDFLEDPARRSPLGPTAPGDVSFYGSGWSLTRWAIDHASIAEEVFLQQLTSVSYTHLTLPTNREV